MSNGGSGSLFDFLIRLLFQQLGDPASPFYLPQMIRTSSPPYDPFAAGSFPSPSLDSVVSGATVICRLSAGRGSFGQPAALPSLLLSNVTITGLSNAQLGAPEIVDTPDGATVGSTVQLSTLPGLPPSIDVAGSFALDQLCCRKDREHQNDPCDPANPRFTAVGTGTFVARIAASSGSGRGSVTIDPVSGEPVVTVESLTYSAAATPANVAIELRIDNIDDPTSREIWSDYATSAFTTPSTIAQLIAGINSTLGAPATLAVASEQLTAALRSLVAATPEARRRLANRPAR